MQKIDELTSPPVPGRFYLVPCVRVPFKTIAFKIGDWVPIIGSLHDDKEIGANFLHFHYDRRFFKAAVPARSVIAFSRYNFIFPDLNTPIEYRRKKCYRLADSIFRSGTRSTVCLLEEVLPEDLLLQGTRCPHRGFDLASVPIENGCVTCPLHGLKWEIGVGLVKLSEERDA